MNVLSDYVLGFYDGPHATPKEADEGPIFLGIKNVTPDGRLDFSEIRHVSEQEFARWTKRVKPQFGDVVFSYEATLHRYALIPEGFEGCLGRRMALIRPDPTKLDARFLHFYLLSPRWRNQVDANVITGATVNRLPLTKVPSFAVDFPDLLNQQRIATILSAYDDLIENNRRRIALLEEAARQLYKEWFVRFRFPGHEHVKIIDGVPDGWERKLLGEIARVVMGQSPQSKFYNDAGIGLPFHQGVTNYGFRFVSHHTYSSAVTKLAEANDILVSVRAPVGRINITLDRIVLGRGLSAIRSKSGHQSFLLYALKEHFYAEDIIGTGAIYAATNKKELEAQQMLIPVGPLVTAFEDASLPIDRQITNLTKSVEYLTKARDLLLPKLMSGAIAV